MDKDYTSNPAIASMDDNGLPWYSSVDFFLKYLYVANGNDELILITSITSAQDR